MEYSWQTIHWKMTEYNDLLEMWREEKKKREEAEGELTIVRGIDNTSSEMKALKKENEELRKEIGEVREDNKKLATQVNDRVDRLRKAGLM
jgi:predicted  nucleic acid-binding Zn-ribbon protein